MALSRRVSEDKVQLAEQAGEEVLQVQRRNSQWDAREFIEAFVREGWESYWSSITVTCDITLQELHNIGHLPRSQGTRECRKLLRAPVINDEIGTALWEKLAGMVVRGEEVSLDVNDPDALRSWQQGQARERMRQEINFMRHHNKTARRRSISPPPQSPRQKDQLENGGDDCILCVPGQRHLSPSLASAGSPEIQVMSPLATIRTEEPTTPDAEPTSTGTGAAGGTPRKLSWILPLPGRRRSSVATRFSPKSSATTTTTPLTSPIKSGANTNPGGMMWEEGFWQQREKQEVRRAEPNKPFANVDRDTTPANAIAEIVALATTTAQVTPRMGEEEQEAQDDEYRDLVDPFEASSAHTHQSPKSMISSFTASSTTTTASTVGGGKESLSFPKRILRKLSGPHLLANIGEFGESLGVGYGSRDV